MSSLQGFRCRHCRMELLAQPPELVRHAVADWTPPITCCGSPLLRLPPEQVLGAQLPRRRRARCPRCGAEVRLIVHPDGPLACLICQREFALSFGERPATEAATLPGTEEAA
jgi:DNA-directed RNA polymerase subunit RPC12/RpoP